MILPLKAHPLKRFLAKPQCLRVTAGHQLPWTCQTLFELRYTIGLLQWAAHLAIFSGEKNFPPLVLNLYSTTAINLLVQEIQYTHSSFAISKCFTDLYHTYMSLLCWRVLSIKSNCVLSFSLSLPFSSSAQAPFASVSSWEDSCGLRSYAPCWGALCSSLLGGEQTAVLQGPAVGKPAAGWKPLQMGFGLFASRVG